MRLPCKRYYLASADPGHPCRWLGSAIWMTLVSYIDCLSQPIREEYSPSFFTCQLLPLIIIFHPPSTINHFPSSLFSFHPQTAMIQRVNMSVKAFWNRKKNEQQDINGLIDVFFVKIIRKSIRISFFFSTFVPNIFI